ncbi:entericidin A/B family lipoprotein [Sphingomonas corticis]|jgi:predicted small secreted protein|uniref:Entericidin A/B family lipoprotein n=1 Tax=Sphingomonas corticis TaxID=2722791 RepID=A0ABX1CMD8_9SPHN|nr:entericidin A/B family lipoprotein [Sphingomonas corticis]NJR78594.1 entericidin A/B family lipoprotein [Sphingomonas corticis]
MKTTFALTAALAAALALAACNTVNGAGKDLKSAGGAVSDASGKDGQK